MAFKAKTISAHLDLLCYGRASVTQSLSISTHFLDTSLLSSIAHLGSFGVLRHLELGTTGTKLGSDGLKKVIEGCHALESLRLRDVEGKTL